MCKTTMPALRRFGARQVACHFAEEFLPGHEAHETESRSQDKIRARQAPAVTVAHAAKAENATDSIDALVTASAQALGLTLDPAWRDSVKFNLRLILRHAALVDEFPLPDDAEPAPVFHA